LAVKTISLRAVLAARSRATIAKFTAARRGTFLLATVIATGSPHLEFRRLHRQWFHFDRGWQRVSIGQRQFHPQMPFHAFNEMPLIVTAQGDCCALTPCTSGSADPMDVSFRRFRAIEIDHSSNPSHIDPTGRDIGGD
jgi:hypothetical protein